MGQLGINGLWRIEILRHENNVKKEKMIRQKS